MSEKEEQKASGSTDVDDDARRTSVPPSASPQLLRQANEQLVLASLRAQDAAETAEGFRLLVESVKEYAIYTLDCAGRVKTWNAGAERIKGYEAREIVGQHVSVFYPPEEVAAGKCERDLEVATRMERLEEDSVRVRKNGTRFLASVVITALRNGDGEVFGFGTVTRDLSDRVQMERYRLALSRIEEAERTKDEFLAIMGHELRNPLAPMVTAVHLIKLRAGRDSERAILILERQLQHMMRLVDDLLDVARARQGKIKLVSRTVEIGEVLANAVDVASALIESKHHRLILDVPPAGLTVHVDPARMAQVFGNILNNAAKYTDPGGEIRTRALAKDGAVEVTIEDTGVGIAPELMPRLFDLFAQGTQGLARQLGGLGIGLTIAQRLVRAQGGHIRAESDGSGCGSRFTVRLPRGAAVAISDRPVVPAPATSADRPPAHRHVLIVDDNADSCEMMQRLLRRLGHETRIALDGPRALELAEEAAPDIVFLDIGLPGMDGFEVVRLLRKIPSCARIPIMALSGYASDIDRRRALEAGFTEHFAKPVDLEVLARVVETEALVPAHA
jgi:PAS domain S-box-containing protein